jgi:hypothetical protein
MFMNDSVTIITEFVAGLLLEDKWLFMCLIGDICLMAKGKGGVLAFWDLAYVLGTFFIYRSIHNIVEIRRGLI